MAILFGEINFGTFFQKNIQTLYSQIHFHHYQLKVQLNIILR